MNHKYNIFITYLNIFDVTVNKKVISDFVNGF